MTVYIYSNDNDENSGRFLHTYFCDPQTDWTFQCLTIIEDYLISESKLTVLHGSALVFGGNTFIILGERFSGKSTLTHYILNNTNSIFLDDDNVLYNSGEIYGLNLPMRLRNKPSSLENLICKFIDEYNNPRYLIDATNVQFQGTDSIFIIFPHYLKNSVPSFYKIHGQTLFEKLLKSVKYSFNNQQCFQDVCSIVKSINAYYTEYDDCAYVLSQINNLSR